MKSRLILTELIILSLCFVIIYILITKSFDTAVNTSNKSSTSQINSYIKHKLDPSRTKSLLKKYINKEFDKDVLYEILDNKNLKASFTTSFSANNEPFYPPVDKEFIDLLDKVPVNSNIDKQVLLVGKDLVIISRITIDNSTAITLYTMSRDELLKGFIDPDKIDGFGLSSGGVFFDLVNNSYKKDYILIDSEQYKLRHKKQYICIKNDFDVQGLYFIRNDEVLVKKYNTILILVFSIFLIQLLISAALTNHSLKKFSRLLEQLVTDTKELAIKGRHNSFKRRYGFSEFRSLDSAFRLVIRKRERLENKLMESIGQMEHTVQSRTKELTTAVDNAVAANQGKMNFLSSVSHEIRTPMNCIIGFCEIIINDSEDSKCVEYARRIIHETETLLHLVNDILDQSKIESGKMVLSVDKVNIASFVQDIISLGNPYYKKVSTDYVVEGDIPPSIGIDKVRLYQVVSNLYFNALKYTPSGSVTVFINILDNNLNIDVVDTGIGIPENRIDTVFDQYQQLETGLTREYRGTGLGLTITKKIVELMGGSISVKSEQENGSCFSVKIPFLSVINNNISDDEIIQNVLPIRNKNFTVLVVEDYPTNRIIAKKHLESGGFIVQEVQNGKEAVDICNIEHFDIILMDIQMPVMNGFDSTVEIRSHSKFNSDTPIVAMTANGLQSIHERCFESGMNDIIIKPIRKESFLRVLTKNLIGDAIV